MKGISIYLKQDLSLDSRSKCISQDYRQNVTEYTPIYPLFVSRFYLGMIIVILIMGEEPVKAFVAARGD